MGTGGKRPGSAALAAAASEIGTWSQPGRPKGAASPLSKSVATSTKRRPRSRCSWRKSLLRPGAVSRLRTWRSSGALLNRPVGSARPRCSSEASSERPLKANPKAAIANRPGKAASRRAYSLSAGRTNRLGRTMSLRGPLFSMNALHSWRGVMPLASPAATKPPAETPT